MINRLRSKEAAQSKDPSGIGMACAMIAEALTYLEGEIEFTLADVPLRGIAGPWLGDRWKEFGDLCVGRGSMSIGIVALADNRRRMALSIPIRAHCYLKASCNMLKAGYDWVPEEISLSGNVMAVVGNRTLSFARVDNQPGVYCVAAI